MFTGSFHQWFGSKDEAQYRVRLLLVALSDVLRFRSFTPSMWFVSYTPNVCMRFYANCTFRRKLHSVPTNLISFPQNVVTDTSRQYQGKAIYTME